MEVKFHAFLTYEFGKEPLKIQGFSDFLWVLELR